MLTDTYRIVESVRQTGWCRLERMSDAEYRWLVGRLGTPWCETAVELRPDVRSYLCKPEAVPFHTDHPEADWMSWRCEVQDDSDGTQQLVDGREALHACGRQVRDALTCVHAEVRVRQDAPSARVPIVRSSKDGDRVFFAPWIKPLETDALSTGAFATLSAEISRRCECAVEEVRLKEGEVLIIDNGRLLHGRKGLNADSRRRLRRFWITRDEYASIRSVGAT